MSNRSVWFEKGGTRVYLDSAYPIEWRFTHGGDAPRQRFILSSTADAQLLAADALGDGYGPWSLNFDGEARIDQLYFIERPGTVGRDRVAWEVSDARWPLQGYLVDLSFNRMRQIDDFDRADPKAIGEDVSLFTQVPKRQFLPNFCRADDSIVGARFQTRPVDLGFVEFEPWTALSALVYLLSDDGYIANFPPQGGFFGNAPFSFVGGGPIIDDRVRERKIILPPDYNPGGMWDAAINELARMARVLVYPDETGRFVIVPSDPTDAIFVGTGYGYYDSRQTGVPTLVTYQNQAPRTLRVHFPEWLEIRWDYDEMLAMELAGVSPTNYPNVPARYLPKRPLAADLLNSPRFLLENVVKVPQDTSRHRKGQWGELFAVLGDWANNKDAYAVGRGLLGTPDKLFIPQILRAHILTQGLGQAWQRDINALDFRDNILEARVATAYTYYRRYFRIPDFWMDYIQSFRATTSEIFSFTSRTRQPSPLYVDYHAWDTYVAQMPGGPGVMDAYSAARGEGYLRNVPVDGYKQGWIEQADADNPASMPRGVNLTLEQMTPAPGEVSIVDVDIGVISYSLNPDLTNTTTAREPGLAYMASVEPGTKLTGAEARIRTAARQAGLINFAGKFAAAPQFRFVTILSCLWLTPNNPKRFYTVLKDGARFVANANGPARDLLHNGFDVVRRYEEGKVGHTSTPTEGVRVQHGGKIANEQLVEELAESKAQNLYYGYIPKVLGVYRAFGWHGQKPFGNIDETAVVFTNGLLETEVSATDQIPRPSVFEFLSPDVRNIMMRLPEITR